MSEAAFDDLRDLYQAVVIDRSRHPRHGAPLACFDGSAEGDNPMCGDRVHVTIRRDAAGRIEETGFKARGCAISIASADLMADAVAGLDAEEIAPLVEEFRALVTTGTAPAAPRLEALHALAGVHAYPSRVKCATLAWDALLTALAARKEAAA